MIEIQMMWADMYKLCVASSRYEAFSCASAVIPRFSTYLPRSMWCKSATLPGTLMAGDRIGCVVLTCPRCVAFRVPILLLFGPPPPLLDQSVLCASGRTAEGERTTSSYGASLIPAVRGVESVEAREESAGELGPMNRDDSLDVIPLDSCPRWTLPPLIAGLEELRVTLPLGARTSGMALRPVGVMVGGLNGLRKAPTVTKGLARPLGWDDANTAAADKVSVDEGDRGMVGR